MDETNVPMGQAGVMRRFPLFLVALCAAYLATAVSVSAAERNSVVRTGTINEDVMSAGDRVDIRAQIDGNVMATGGEVTIHSGITGDLYAVGGDLTAGDDIDGDVFVLGGKVDSRGRVGGALFAAGGSLRTEAEIAGDALIAGGQVEADNKVGGDLRMAGGDVSTKAAVGGKLMIAGGKVEIEHAADIQGSAWAAGGDVEVNGTIRGNLRAAGRHVEIGGEIFGNVNIDANEVEILPSAKIHGNLSYRSPEAADIGSGASIQGDVTFVQSEGAKHAFGSMFAAAGGAVLSVFLSLLVMGIVQILVLPRLSLQAARVGNGAPWMALGLGFVIVVAVPVALLIAILTIVSIPLVIVVGAAYVVALGLGIVVASVIVARWIVRLFGRNWDDRIWGRVVLVLIGLLVFTIVGLIPFVGALAVFLALCLGTGAIVAQLFRRRAALAD